MSETSGFFDAEELTDGTYDRTYIADQYANYFKLFVGNGVFASPTDQCKVIAGSGLNVIMKAGWAFLNGYWYHNDADLTLPITPNVTASDRTDAVMLRFDNSARTISAQVTVANTAVDRTTYYDLKTTEIVIGTGATEITPVNITDTRSNEAVCGFVTGLFDIIPTNDLFSQFQAMFDTWFNTVKGQLTEDAAGKLTTDLNTEISDRQSADASEVIARENADTAEATTRGKNDWYLYHATYTTAGWVTSGSTFTQSQTISGMTATTQLMQPTVKHTGVQADDAAMDTALGIINAGTVDSQAGAVLITVWEKPISDVTVYWVGKETA